MSFFFYKTKRFYFMSILTHDEILKEVKAGNIGIDPFVENAIGPASIDLRLDNRFRTFKKIQGTFDVTEEANYEQVTEYLEIPQDGTYLLLPGESVLGITLETISLPPSVCGWLEGRSRFARVGLTVHVTASFMQPGISNKQVLEINNVSPIPLLLHPGTYICQFIFQQCVGEACYSGRFVNQIKP